MNASLDSYDSLGSSANNDISTVATVLSEDQFPALAELLEDLLTPQLILAEDPLAPEHQMGLFVESIHFELPLEIQTLRDHEQHLVLGTSPPTQWIETSVQPVLHRLRLNLALDEEAEWTSSSKPDTPINVDVIPEPGDDQPRNQSLES
ncbi:Hypothetical protein HDN1F_21910 [gamma proteobacterium HdN1]|nr:Hypothetical protein HDN1F_21910 [gamma proteobacterium HdN1]